MAPSRQSPQGRLIWAKVARLALVAVVYWVAVWFGLLFVVEPGGIGAIWPASGLALAVLLLHERRDWMPLLITIFITNVVGNLSGGVSLPTSLGFALANSAEAALGAWVMIHLCGPRITFTRLKEVLALCSVAVFSNGVTASYQVCVYRAGFRSNTRTASASSSG